MELKKLLLPAKAYWPNMDIMSDIVVFSIQVSVGTLLAFTMVAISVLILRYVPPDEVPLPSSLQDSIGSITSRLRTQDTIRKSFDAPAGTSEDSKRPLLGVKEIDVDCPLIVQKALGKCEHRILLSTPYSFHQIS